MTDPLNNTRTTSHSPDSTTSSRTSTPAHPTTSQQPLLPTTGRTTHRISTSIKIEENLWSAVKHHCVEAHTTIADYLEQVIRNELRK